MKILGISSGHDSGAAIIEDGKIIAAVNEERLNREKLYWGVPVLAIKECLRLAKCELKDIDVVAAANIVSGSDLQKQFRTTGRITLKKRIFDLVSFLGLFDKRFVKKAYLSLFGRFRQEREVMNMFKEQGLKPKTHFIEHHLCHAVSAYYTSPFKTDDRVIVMTTDGSGDGLCSAIFTVDESGFLRRQSETSFFHSPASVYYSNVTFNLGYKPLRHEGKITGLAAFGNADKTIDIFRKYLTVNLNKLQYRSKIGCYGQPAAKKLHLACWGQKREDIAAGVQKRIEEAASALAGEAATRFGCDKVCAAGGLFANVRLNQVIYDLPHIKDIYIHPHMGDGGLAVGAALSIWLEHCRKQNKKVAPKKLENVFLGPEFSEKEIEETLKKGKAEYTRYEEVEEEIAKLLAGGKVVARFNGAMEYGPRALCNRSILYQPTDPTVNDWLNKRLSRTEFMPFAPVVLFEDAGEYFESFDRDHCFASEFMTITYRATEKCKKEAPAVVHVDGTARPQVLRKGVNPSMYKILREYKKLTGISTVINTSFNMHEEPIVCTPQDALRAFRMGHLDVLAIGNFIVTK